MCGRYNKGFAFVKCESSIFKPLAFSAQDKQIYKNHLQKASVASFLELVIQCWLLGEPRTIV